MQRFISDAEWDEDKISRKYRHMVNDDMGDPNGILIFDESKKEKRQKNKPTSFTKRLSPNPS
jgi:hypothetical protein